MIENGRGREQTSYLSTYTYSLLIVRATASPLDP